MFIDKTKIKIISGDGGNGMVAWRREKYVDKGGPAGGDGGKGGDVILIADNNLSTLLDFTYKSRFAAELGENGGAKNKYGKKGADILIKVPCGTVIKDAASGKIIGDLIKNGETLLLASGGRGGRGNARFATSVRRAPQFCEPGEPGIEREIELELKLIADVGLLGMPNAGKSTLISVISAAKPKIANYPFTTLVPNLGIIKKPDGDGIVIADLPGLIEGAGTGTGLGFEFLRHAERTKFLLHLLDLTEEDPVNNHKIINGELEKYGGRLSEIRQVVVLNKLDAAEPEKIQEIKEYFEAENNEVFVISAATGEGTKDLVNMLIQKVDEIPAPEFNIETEKDEDAYNHDDSEYTIKSYGNFFTVQGGKIERLAAITDLRNTEAIFRLQNIFRAMGIFKALGKSGIQDGDIVKVGEFEFEYYSDELKEDS